MVPWHTNDMPLAFSDHREVIFRIEGVIPSSWKSRRALI